MVRKYYRRKPNQRTEAMKRGKGTIGMQQRLLKSSLSFFDESELAPPKVIPSTVSVEGGAIKDVRDDCPASIINMCRSPRRPIQEAVWYKS